MRKRTQPAACAGAMPNHQGAGAATPPLKVISLSARRDNETIGALEKLLERARAGRIKGFAFVVKYYGARHEPGVTGDYRHDRINAVGAVMELVRQLQRMPDSEAR